MAGLSRRASMTLMPRVVGEVVVDVVHTPSVALSQIDRKRINNQVRSIIYKNH
jgi:hypothetical protein